MTGTHRPRILLVGGGHVGLAAARGLERELRADEADLVLVSPENFMLYQPLLPEVASGTVEPRHVVVPLRKALRRTRLVVGRLTDLDHVRRCARVQPHEGPPSDLGYDHVVVALGAESRALPVPGLTEHAVGFQSLAEATHLRDHVLDRLEVAAATTDEVARRRALTFVFVGGGYTGVEALGELEDMARSATRHFPELRDERLRWVLVEATDHILPTVAPGLRDVAVRELRRRGVEILLETQLQSAEGGRLVLSDGQVVDADTLVWSAGMSVHPLVGELGLPTDDRGALVVDACLQVDGVAGAWAAGDCAAVPDLARGGTAPPTAQHAEREARQLAANLAAAVRGRPPEPFRYESAGELVTLGRHKAVADLYGRHLTGFLPWLLRRVYLATRMPTTERKLRLAVDSFVDLAFRRDVVSLGSIRRPEAPLEKAADPDRKA